MFVLARSSPEFAYSLLLKTLMQTSLLFLAPLLLLPSLLFLRVPAVADISALDNFSDILCGGISCVPGIADSPTIAIITDLFLLPIATVLTLCQYWRSRSCLLLFSFCCWSMYCMLFDTMLLLTFTTPFLASLLLLDSLLIQTSLLPPLFVFVS
jgi:hypothetical protein